MEKCIVCKRDLLDEDDVCYSCLQFLEWKYGNRGSLQKIEEMKRHAQLNSGGKK